MKFCQRRNHTYLNANNIETSVHYVTIEDVIAFHGNMFAEQWLEFIKLKPTLKKDCYYYDDYKFAARQTDSYLNPIQ